MCSHCQRLRKDLPQALESQCRLSSSDTDMETDGECSLPSTLSTKYPLSQRKSETSDMGVCYTKCVDVGAMDPSLYDQRSVMATANDPLLAVYGRNVAMERQDQASKVQKTVTATKMPVDAKVNDLEEWGVTTSQATVVESSLVVDYEDADARTVSSHSASVECAVDACGTLDTILPAESRDDEMDITKLQSKTRPRALSGNGSKSGVRRGRSTSTSNVVTEEEQPAAETRCSSLPRLCHCEVKLHASRDSCWLVSKGNVYDVTGLLDAHPGGERAILRKAGGPDCHEDMMFHTKRARKIMDKCFIGKLQSCCTGDASQTAGEAANCCIQ